MPLPFPCWGYASGWHATAPKLQSDMIFLFPVEKTISDHYKIEVIQLQWNTQTITRKKILPLKNVLEIICPHRQVTAI